jgi:hypothetical protein
MHCHETTKIIQLGGSLASPTNLSYLATAVDATVISSTGTDATLNLATNTLAGLMSPKDAMTVSKLLNSPLTIAQRNAVIPIAGMLAWVVDGVTKEYQYYDGSSWNPVGTTESNWITTTGVYTAIDDDRVIIGGAHTVTLPASPVQGESILFVPGNADWTTLNASFDSGTNTINNNNVFTLTGGEAITMVFDATSSDWKIVSGSTPVISPTSRLFADNTSVSPTTAGNPTVVEIAAFVGTTVDSIVYYNGTDISTNTPTYVYHVDASGNVTLLEKPSIVYNDQASSGFFDMASMRIAWGRVLSTGDNDQTVTFSASFLSVPAVTYSLEVQNGGNFTTGLGAGATEIKTVTTTNFVVNRDDTVGAVDSPIINYIAIGLKP